MSSRDNRGRGRGSKETLQQGAGSLLFSEGVAYRGQSWTDLKRAKHHRFK